MVHLLLGREGELMHQVACRGARRAGVGGGGAGSVRGHHQAHCRTDCWRAGRLCDLSRAGRGSQGGLHGREDVGHRGGRPARRRVIDQMSGDHLATVSEPQGATEELHLPGGARLLEVAGLLVEALAAAGVRVLPRKGWHRQRHMRGESAGRLMMQRGPGGEDRAQARDASCWCGLMGRGPRSLLLCTCAHDSGAYGCLGQRISAT